MPVRPTTALRSTLVPGSLALVLALGACGTDAGSTDATDAGRGVTVENCGAEVSFDAPPERAVLLKSAAVPFLAAIDVLDRVEARAGTYPREYYDDETLEALDRIPVLTDELDTSGHLQISRESVVSLGSDLVLGEVDNLSRESLAALDVPLLEEPALCDLPGAEPSWDDVWAQLRLYGEVFDREEAAEEAVGDLRARLATLEQRGAEREPMSAAVLYPSVGGGATYAYGSGSMAQPQLESAGLSNVFADVDERVFEVGVEELLGRDPDVLVLLHTQGEPADVVRTVLDLPGAERLGAVRRGAVQTLLFNFTEPASPLALDGLERLIDGLPS